jgi:D-alanyl-D-alanine carboxypeptidase
MKIFFKIPVHIFLLINFLNPALSYAHSDFNKMKLDSLLDKLSSKNKFMGSITIRKNDKILFSKAYGSSYIGNGKKIASTPDTKYRIGSISKMFTSTMIFQLFEEKKLSLDTKLSNFFPDIPNANIITINNLLYHRSGIFNITNDSDYGIWHLEKQSEADMIKKMKNHPADFKPDEKTSYSNSNFILLGYIIEKITGNDYATNLEERIVKRIGLRNTYFGSKADLSKNESFSYYIENDEWEQEPATDMSVPGGAGAIVSTTNDLSHFITALFNGKLIAQSSLDSMTTIIDGLGRGIFAVPFGKRQAFGHNGGIDKFVSGLSYFPDDSVSYAICTNGLDYNMNSISIGVLKIFYNLPYEIPSLEKIAVNQEILEKYAGVYSSKELPMKIKIDNHNKKLTAQATGQPAFPLDAVNDKEFKFDQAGIKIAFKKENELILKQGGQEFTLTKE